MSNIVKRPEWLKVKAPVSKGYENIRQMMKELNLSTVCQEALCPNIGECWGGEKGTGGTATFMLMGDTCTRACKFCAVKTGNPKGVLDLDEPYKVGKAIAQLDLDYIVLTSVDRDDLEDEGSSHFAKTIGVIKRNNSKMIVEALTPDFSAKYEHLEKLIREKVDVFAHNIETVERLTPSVRDRRSTYRQSLLTLKRIKEIKKDQYTKTSIMLGIGETKDEIIKSLEDLREVGCDVVTFGQYLRPTPRHLEMKEYVSPDLFLEYEQIANKMGFLYVASGPLVRSSYKAGEYFMTKHIRSKNTESLYELNN